MSVTYHYILTVQKTTATGGAAVLTTSGPITVEPGATRAQVFHLMYERAQEATGTENLSVLFFALEPNALGGS